jgi:catechol 2,3-dioxygenase-like lactoylglutathione lyase family enzyme
MARVQLRYIVRDVSAAIAFYTQHHGFNLQMHPAPPFAMLSPGELRLMLSAPNPSPGRATDPRRTAAGSGRLEPLRDRGAGPGPNVAALRKTGVRFRNEIVTGVGGKQIIAEDSSGNPVELFQPTQPAARLR